MAAEDAGTLLFVTQVAPYRDGPAGVHGVLDQAAVAVAQVAELHGLEARRIVDVRALEPHAIADARAVVLFTIGETPWSAAQRHDLLEGVRSGRLALVAVHSATVWPREEFGTKAILCGACKAELAINEYLECDSKCGRCGATFNPRCANHYDLYFEI